MDDLERAIIISFDESGSVDPGLKSQVTAYCQRIKESQGICRVCMEKVLFCTFPQVQFWCLKTVQEVVRDRFSSVDAEERLFVRKSVASIACADGLDEGSAGARVLDGPAFIKNKLAQVFVTLVFFEYPSPWSSAFLDFLPHLRKGAAVIDMFCRVLNALDDELISLDYPRSPEEVRVSAHVKDAMRQQCVPQIVRAWYDVVVLYKSSKPELAAFVLDTMRRYVNWIDIGLIANDVFLPMLFETILVDGHPDQLRASSAGCVLAMVSKRMEPKAKLTLLRSLRISRIFGMVVENEESELGSSLGSLLLGYATEVLECSKRLESEDIYNESVELLDEVLPSIFYVMQRSEEETTFSSLQFLSAYVSKMKTLSPLKEKQMLHLGQILEVIRGKIRYDPAYRESLDLPDKIGREEEERMTEYRKDLFVLFRSVSRIAQDVTQLFVMNSLAAAVLGSAEVEFEDVESAISLFYALGEAINEEGIRTGTGLLSEMMPMLLSAKFSFHSHRLVALVYLETISRYVGFVHEHTQYIPLVLAAFLDERGIRHPNINVSRRASYLFMRIVKVLRVNLLPFIETILQSLQDTMVRLTRLEWALKDLDGSHIFEAIGMLIGMEDVSPEKQSEYLSLLLIPLCQQVDTLLSSVKTDDDPAELSAKVAYVQQIISAINSLSKGFSERLVTASRPTIGIMFKQTLDVLLKVLLVFPKNEQLRTKVTSFVHRMVDTLGACIFPYLPRALEQLLVDSETKEMVGFLVLINQLILKFKTAMGSIMEEIFPSIASRVFHVLPKDLFPSGPGSNTEEIRELQELQRTLFTFLHVMTTNDLSSVLLAPNSRGYLDAVIQLLLYNACGHKDILIRKACVQIFVKLIKDWCSRSNGEEKVPGFRTFIIESFAPNCCLYSVLDSSFELRDANTLVLLGEIVVAQKVMYENLGDEFLIHFVTKGFPAAHCPQNLAEQYCQKLQSGDMKTLKCFYQSLIESLRCQQNGSLVFR
ncbi:exportin-T [Nymphaea colorata]|nr:exportin-T [Nymphaea colorata]XP_031497602.1 exportin-T [Nymphaea colorata]